MEQYFQDVVSSLSIEDMNVLGILYDNEAKASFRAMRNVEVLIASGLTAATFRRIMYRLIANRFVETMLGKKSHSLYITQYGVAALKASLEEVTS